MQFTVLIEFLVPGLATTLLALAFLPCGALPQLPEGIPTGETATALLLLAVSYPVGILTNFPFYRLLQRPWLTLRAQRGIVEKFKINGIDLAELGSQHLKVSATATLRATSREELQELFDFMRAAVFSMNIARLNYNHMYHEGLQRFSRGMFVPLVMAGVLVSRDHGPAWVLLALGGFLIVSAALLIFSIKTEDEQIARYFVVMVAAKQQVVIPAGAPVQATEAVTKST